MQRVFTVFGFLLVGSLILASAPAMSEEGDPAIRLERQGMMLIQRGKVDEGLALMRKNISENSENPQMHMNLGNMLFAVGNMRHQSGHADAALPLLKESKEHLEKAVDLYTDRDAPMKSHAYYLLGDLERYVFNDRDKAKQYYERSLELWDHEDAAQALKNL